MTIVVGVLLLVTIALPRLLRGTQDGKMTQRMSRDTDATIVLDIGKTNVKLVAARCRRAPRWPSGAAQYDPATTRPIRTTTSEGIWDWMLATCRKPLRRWRVSARSSR